MFWEHFRRYIMSEMKDMDGVIDDIKDDIKDKVDDVKDKVEEVKDDVEDKAEDVKEKVKLFIEKHGKVIVFTSIISIVIGVLIGIGIM